MGVVAAGAFTVALGVVSGLGPRGAVIVAALTGIGLALGSSVGAAVGRRLAPPTERVTRLATQIALGRGRLRE